MAYEFVEHTAEVEVALQAPTLAGLYDAAARAFAELVATGEAGAPAAHELELPGVDPALLLVDLLGELVFLAETDGFVPARLAADFDGARLRVRLEGVRERPRPLVKAVTLSGLEVREEAGRWRGRVVLDV